MFKKYEFVYKRGIILYGAPGTGKTCLINMLCKHLIEDMGGVIFILTTSDDLTYYEHVMPEIFRVIEKDRPIITVIEDIDGLCSNKNSETRLINILDGISQLENIVYVATTNYMEQLSARITNRPNRFDRRIEVKAPNRECREIYFRHKLKKEDVKKVNMKQWLDLTEGLTMAHLGEIVKSVIIFGHPLNEVVDMLKGMKQTPVSRKYNENGIGFTAPVEEDKYSLKYSEEEEESVATGYAEGGGEEAINRDGELTPETINVNTLSKYIKDEAAKRNKRDSTAPPKKKKKKVVIYDWENSGLLDGIYFDGLKPHKKKK